jgi:hypothetical protein
MILSLLNLKFHKSLNINMSKLRKKIKSVPLIVELVKNLKKYY